jgi:hypothetical protein
MKTKIPLEQDGKFQQHEGDTQSISELKVQTETHHASHLHSAHGEGWDPTAKKVAIRQRGES